MRLTDQCSTRTLRDQSLEEVYEADVVPLQKKPTYRTFQRWYTTGTRFAAVAGGGTVYVLVLVAGLGLRSSLASIPGDLTYHLGNALRNPDPGKIFFFAMPGGSSPTYRSLQTLKSAQPSYGRSFRSFISCGACSQ